MIATDRKDLKAALMAGRTRTWGMAALFCAVAFLGGMILLAWLQWSWAGLPIFFLGLIVVACFLEKPPAAETPAPRPKSSWPIAIALVLVLVPAAILFFVNDTMCLVLTPLVLEITTSLRRRPVPYLLAVAMASNIGSVATITGNPQNMMIGSFSRIPYRVFAASLAPVAAVGLLLTIAVIAFLYRDEFRASNELRAEHRAVRVNRMLMAKAVAVTLAMIVFFFAGQPHTAAFRWPPTHSGSPRPPAGATGPGNRKYPGSAGAGPSPRRP